jgi:hypothetical protein
MGSGNVAQTSGVILPMLNCFWTADIVCSAVGLRTLVGVGMRTS